MLDPEPLSHVPFHVARLRCPACGYECLDTRVAAIDAPACPACGYGDVEVIGDVNGPAVPPSEEEIS